MNKPQLSEMDLYCIARLIQSSFQAPDQETIDNTYRPLYGCMYCKYSLKCHEPGVTQLNFRKVFDKLNTLTGVSLGTHFVDQNIPEDIGSVFFHASYYIEHPEVLCELEKVHPKSMMDGFRTCLEKIITRSRDVPG